MHGYHLFVLGKTFLVMAIFWVLKMSLQCENHHLVPQCLFVLSTFHGTKIEGFHPGYKI